MVKKLVILFLFLLFYNNSIAQEQKDLWWVQTPLNKKYEDNYKYLFSEIKDCILKDQVIEFIKNYITNTDNKNEEVAIEISSLYSKKSNEKIYRITYILDYYDFIPFNYSVYQINYNVNRIAEIKGRIIFIHDEHLNDFRIKKEILFGLFRDRYKKEKKLLNEQYKNLKKNGGGIPVLIPRTYHHVPNYILIIRNNKLIDKKITYE